MGDSYVATGNITAVTASPGDSALSVDGVTTSRGRIGHIVLSQGATPDDKVIQWLVRRKTTAGTATSVTPALTDLGAPAALLGASQIYTTEPTITAATELFDGDVNQRATYTLITAPGKELVVPATANAGIIITPISAAYAGIASATAYWDE